MESTTVFVLYGATGDLARRMVLPAFATLAARDLLPREWVLVGNGRGDVSHDEFRKRVREALTEFGDEPDAALWEKIEPRLLFAGGGFTADDPGSLPAVLDEARGIAGEDAPLVHYLAVPPTTFGDYTRALDAHGLAGGARVVYEKPYGTSPDGFRDLDELVHRVLDEERVYRIDHFLGKEATQNLRVLRSANELVAAVWDRTHIEAVQIDVPEELDIDDRAEFYDATGATLDMLVTHLFQVAAEIALEPPATPDAAALRDAREEVVRAFRPLDPAEVVLGQFAGYPDVEGIDDDSTTDTYVAARLWIDNPRWQGVPFLLRTGKRMAASGQRVSIVLRAAAGRPANVLTFTLDGDSEVTLDLLAKKPGTGHDVAPAPMTLSPGSLPGQPLPAYARLLHDVLEGDRSLFTSPAGLSAAWQAAAPLLDDRPAVQRYEQGTWGPEAARDLAAPHGWLLGQ